MPNAMPQPLRAGFSAWPDRLPQTEKNGAPVNGRPAFPEGSRHGGNYFMSTALTQMRASWDMALPSNSLTGPTPMAAKPHQPALGMA